jgi:outer membrane protein
LFHEKVWVVRFRHFDTGPRLRGLSRGSGRKDGVCGYPGDHALQEKEVELKKLKDELEKQRPLLKDDVMKERELAYQKKFRDYQLLVKDSNEELQARDQDLSKKLIPDILKLVQAIGEKEKYSMIVDVSAIPLAYYSKENDLTKRVIEEFNKTYKPKK